MIMQEPGSSDTETKKGDDATAAENGDVINVLAIPPAPPADGTENADVDSSGGDNANGDVGDVINVLAIPPAPPISGGKSEPMPPEPNLSSDNTDKPSKPFPPEPRLGNRQALWANGRQYGSVEAAAIALGVTEDMVRQRISSSDDTYDSYRWAE